MNKVSIQPAAPEKSTFFGKCIAVCAFLTVISQLPQVVSMGLSSLISRFIWLGFFALILVLKKGDIRIRSGFFCFGAIGLIVVFSLFASIVNNRTYYNTSLFNAVLLSFFILFIGMSIGKHINGADLRLCAKAYLIATLILSVDLYVTVYRHVSIDDLKYAYESKNSAGVIVFTGFLIAFTYGWKPKKKFANLINLLVIAFLVYMVLVMKVRAMIVCIPVIAVVAALRAPFKKSLKVPLILICVALLIALQNERFYNILINNILFANRQADDINSISSGRADEWRELGNNLVGNWLIGDGKTAQESLILTALIQWGVFAGSLIIAYGFWPLGYALHNIKKDNSSEMFLLLMVALSYFIDAIFEQLAPFGPGGRCFYLWLLFGLLMTRERSDTELKED